jgi:hypothetical protein
MLLDHLGEMREIDPVQAAIELSIIRALRRVGPLKQSDLWYRSSAQSHSRETYHQALESLVERGHIVRITTPRIGVFIYRIAADQRRAERAEAREGSHAD